MILLDTPVWLRWLSAEQSLPAWVMSRIEDAEEVAVSAISCWEVAYLATRGKLDLATRCKTMD